MAATADKDKGISVDTAFLKKYLEKGGVATDQESGKQVDKENVDSFLEDKADSTTADQTKEQKRLHNKAKDAGIETEPSAREQKEQERAEAKRLAEERRIQAEKERTGQAQRRTARQVISNVQEEIVSRVDPAIDQVASMKTVGGIGLLIVILILLLFIVVQVNAQGDTRLKQLWYMVNGRTTLQGRVEVVKGNNPETGGEAVTTYGNVPTDSSVPSSNGAYRSYTSNF